MRGVAVMPAPGRAKGPPEGRHPHFTVAVCKVVDDGIRTRQSDPVSLLSLRDRVAVTTVSAHHSLERDLAAPSGLVQALAVGLQDARAGWFRH